MRVLMLSANTGGGHNSAAAAVRAEFEWRGVACDVKDALSFVSEMHSDIVSSGHTYLYRFFPQLFGVDYRFEERHPPRFIYEQMSLGAKRFAAYLRENPVDAVVCTHIFGNMLMTEVRKRYGVTIPHYVIVTDYALYPGTDMVDVKRYFIGAEGLIPTYVSAGIDEARLTVSGIPVRSSFTQTYDQCAMRRQLGLPEQGRVVLLSGGSIGCGRLHRVAPELEKSLPIDTTLVILCGHNTRMFHQLQERRSDRTVVVGYTDRVAEYMAAADLCITKPGGLSITEALSMQLPLVLMLTVPGCESRNMAFFELCKIAVSTTDWDEAIRATADLIQSPERLQMMRRNMSNIGYPGGAPLIVHTVLDDCSKNQAK